MAVNIRLSYLVYRCSDDCYLESYLPSHFARQFRYDQVYIGNPNPRLGYVGSLIDGSRAWRYFIVDCTGARFCMPHRTSNLLTNLGFYQWYKVSHVPPSSLKINSTRIKLITTHLKGKVEEQRQGKHIWVPNLDEFLADTGSEASVVVSLRLGEVGSELASDIAATTALEEEEMKNKMRIPPLILN